MIFNSIQFVFFFLLVTTLYYLLPHKYRWLLLLSASCYFYMAFIPVYILILGFTIVIDYFAGILLETGKGNRRKFFLYASLVANIGVLCTFKYYNFLNDNFTVFLSQFGYRNPFPFMSILLPIGLSFHTFQAMSYTIEVYRGNQKAERNFGIYALYVMFYPQLVAGPIERPQNILHQFYVKHRFDQEKVVSGLKQMLIGFLKKLVIADRLSIYVDTVYNHSSSQNGQTLAIATLFFAVQIYCDFSGYSDIAIGCARVMGFDLMKNFDRPYMSKSVSEFWRRWHISLSTWFRDYLFIPLGGSRVKKARLYLNLLVVFTVSGIWHGANWTFVIWGALNGIFLIAESILKPKMTYDTWWKKLLNMALTFGLICFTWIFFRATSATEGFRIIGKILRFEGPVYLGYPKDHFYYCLLFIVLLGAYELNQEFFKGRISLFHHPKPVFRYAFYTVAVAIILLFGVFDGGQFIYFQF